MITGVERSCHINKTYRKLSTYAILYNRFLGWKIKKDQNDALGTSSVYDYFLVTQYLIQYYEHASI